MTNVKQAVANLITTTESNWWEREEEAVRRAGAVAATVAGGVAAIAVTILWAGLFPELRRARTFELPEPPPEEADVVSSGV